MLIGSFLGIDSLVSSKTQRLLGAHVVRDRARFFEKNIFAQKMDGENGQKIRFFKYIGKFSH